MHAAHERGVTSIYISHHLQEIFQVCDVVAVLRDGKLVEANDISAHSIESLVSLMVGSDVNQVKSTLQSSRTLGSGEGKEILSIKGLSVESKLNNLDLKIFEGECVGVTGLDGSGHNQLLEVITGVTVPTSGEMVLQGTTISPGNISESIERGIGFCPEDRHFNGYVPALSVAENATMPIHREFRNKFKLINNKARENSYNKLAIAWSIKASGPAQPIEELSGGNQQKVVLARAVSSNPQLLVLNNPTSGVDVSAKESIYKTIADLIKEKQTVLLSSSDISDLEICDRVLVFFGGEIVGEFERPINDAVIAAAVQGKN
jgi:simple sugar transport system ATP-binding protein